MLILETGQKVTSITVDETTIEWVPIRMSKYTVSTTGIVLGHNGKPIKVETGRDNRRKVRLCIDGRKRLYIDELVAEAFVDARPSETAVVCHLDGNMSNDDYRNLEWREEVGNDDDEILEESEKELNEDKRLEESEKELIEDEKVEKFEKESEVNNEEIVGKDESKDNDNDESKDNEDERNAVIIKYRNYKKSVYKISEYGEVRTNKNKIVTSHVSKNKSNSVRLTINGDRKAFSIDMLVAEAFLDPKPCEDAEVIHLDGNPHNCHYTNLEWWYEGVEKIIEGYDGNERWRCIMHLYPGLKIMENCQIFSKSLNKPITLTNLKSGHKQVRFKGKAKIRLHILIALAYLESPEDPSYKYVVHIDPTKDEDGQFVNNHFSNLQWWHQPEIMGDDAINWLSVEDDPDYLVNRKTGEVKSYKSGVPKILNPFTNESGYERLTLSGKKHYVHNVVGAVFHPEEMKKAEQLHHKNRNRKDNSADNLMPTTKKINQLDKNHPPTNPKCRKPILKCSLTGEIIEEFSCADEVVEKLKLKVIPKTVRNWAKAEKLSRGFVWKYKDISYKPWEGERWESMSDRWFDEYYINCSNHIIYESGAVVNTKTGKWYTISRELENYPTVHLNGKKLKIHKLLGLFFIEGRTAEKCIINHKNKDKGNYSLNNLEWVTPSENSRHSLAKSVNQINPKTGKMIQRFDSISDATDYLKKSRKAGSDITLVCNGIRNIAYGYEWEWAEN